ncbi:Carbohydrate Esterase Family 4 protein [Glomus cerebriforme]|uniref:chitin deacetylase n=1 Tax=Glomus cerebriforme TaxID=658196 RepID=A0A397T422_9GLOM|nr:Carbohydrate Esterase Family 4 protein [Glomus cerebriforme]
MKIFPIVTIAFATFCVVNAVPQYDTKAPKTAAPKAPKAAGKGAPTKAAPAPPAPPVAAPAAGTPAAPPAPLTNGYPTTDKVPDPNDPQVLAWLKELDLSKVPNLPISNGGKINPDQANCNPPTVIQPDQGSWTCQKFTAPDDVATCPDVGTWGITFDDGPSTSTPKLLSKLAEHNLKATFFVVGSRAISNPKILKDAYDAGHNIAVHTWSHPALTSLSNEEIVAELKWTMKAIKDVIGVTPIYMRPPYGDTDNRVRAITRAIGLKTVLWLPEFDSNDWTLVSTPPKSIDVVLNSFNTWMQTFPKLNTGFIVLEHDLFPQTVDAATIVIDRAVKVPNLKIVTVPQCVGDSKPYFELVGSNATTTTTTTTTNTGSTYGNNGTTGSFASPVSNVKGSSSASTTSITAGSIIVVLFSSLLNLN